MERAVAIETHDTPRSDGVNFYPKPGYEALDAWLVWCYAAREGRGEEPELPPEQGEFLAHEDSWTVFKLNESNAEEGDPVWWMSDEECPDEDWMDSHTSVWDGGITCPRLAEDAPEEPQALGIRAAQAAYNSYTADMEPDEAADQGVSDLLGDPQGWCRFVPSHWNPGAWVAAFRAAYEQEWREKQAE